MLQFERLTFVPFCVASYPHTLPWEVVALLCEPMRATPTPAVAPPTPYMVLLDQGSSDLLALYFDLLCAEGGKTVAAVTNMLRGDPEVAMVGLESLVTQGPPLRELKTQDGQPL